MTAVLALDLVTRIHGSGETEVHALREVSFRAHAGELVAIGTGTSWTRPSCRRRPATCSQT